MHASTKAAIIAGHSCKYASLFADLVCESSEIPISEDTSFRTVVSDPSAFDDVADPTKQTYALDDHHLAIVIELDHPFFPRKLLNLLLLPFHNWRIQKRLRNMGTVSVRRYGIWPTLRKPTFIFELDTSAELYAHNYLIFSDESYAARSIKFLLKLWSGCDPGIAAIVSVGKLR